MVSKYWKQFENSGKIEDYLSFVSDSGREEEGGQTARVDGHAGIYHCDGNYIETVSGGGVRQSGFGFDEGAR